MMTAAVAAAAPYLFVAQAVGSGLMALRQGEQQNQEMQFRASMAEREASQMRFQSQIALLQGEQKSLQYRREEVAANKQANTVLERLARANAAVVARAGAMNIMPFSGSPLDLQKYNDRKGGDEFMTALGNAESMGRSASREITMGEMNRDAFLSKASYLDSQAGYYRWAGETAEDNAMMKALFSFGQAAFGFSQFGSAPGANSMGSIDRVNSFDDGSMMMYGSSPRF